jgi:hypothetical protein
MELVGLAPQAAKAGFRFSHGRGLIEELTIKIKRLVGTDHQPGGLFRSRHSLG